MFGPVISRVWQPPRGSVLAARPPAPSEFTPVTEARAGLPDAGAARRRQKLRMVRWLRPAYPAELAASGTWYRTRLAGPCPKRTFRLGCAGAPVR